MDMNTNEKRAQKITKHPIHVHGTVSTPAVKSQTELKETSCSINCYTNNSQTKPTAKDNKSQTQKLG